MQPQRFDREFHYYVKPGTDGLQGDSQYWEFSHANGWQMVDKYVGGDWQNETYRVISWPHGIPEAKKGFPPREWILHYHIAHIMGQRP